MATIREARKERYAKRRAQYLSRLWKLSDINKEKYAGLPRNQIAMLSLSQLMKETRPQQRHEVRHALREFIYYLKEKGYNFDETNGEDCNP